MCCHGASVSPPHRPEELRGFFGLAFLGAILEAGVLMALLVWVAKSFPALGFLRAGEGLLSLILIFCAALALLLFSACAFMVTYEEKLRDACYDERQKKLWAVVCLVSPIWFSIRLAYLAVGMVFSWFWVVDDLVDD